MGIFDIFKKKQQQAVPVSVESMRQELIAQTGDDSYEGYPEHLIVSEYRQRNFYRLPERFNLVKIAQMLSNNAPLVVEGFTLLVNSPEEFSQKYEQLCAMHTNDGVPESVDILNITAYGLTGYDSPFKYGAFIDWKEEVEYVMVYLKEAIENLGYTITLSDIEFPDDEQTNESLHRIDLHLEKQGFTLLTLSIGGDCYHLFIVPKDKYSQLVELGESLGFEFSNEFV